MSAPSLSHSTAFSDVPAPAGTAAASSRRRSWRVLPTACSTSARCSVARLAKRASGRVRAEARFASLATEQRAEVEQAVGSTRQLRLRELAAAVPAGAGTSEKAVLWLSDGADIRYAL